jgi:hypothetical protein
MRPGPDPLTSGQLSGFLFRTLHEREERRPYPRGDVCYPLKAYLAVHRCLGLRRALHACGPSLHELIIIGELGGCEPVDRELGGRVDGGFAQGERVRGVRLTNPGARSAPIWIDLKSPLPPSLRPVGQRGG